MIIYGLDNTKRLGKCSLLMLNIYSVILRLEFLIRNRIINVINQENLIRKVDIVVTLYQSILFPRTIFFSKILNNTEI